MSDLGNKKIFAKNLKFYMEREGVDRTTLSKKINVPYNTFSEWYNARIYPTIDTIEKLANYFGILKSDLIEERAKNKIPVLGRIPAGIPIEAIEEILDYEEIPQSWLNGNREYFALKIQGNSMEPTYNTRGYCYFWKS